jgi:hypothetical protein
MSDHWAKEAQRLQSDETLIKALDTMRTEALGELVSADPDDKSGVIRAQERVRAVDEFRATLARMVMAQKPANQKGSFA